MTIEVFIVTNLHFAVLVKLTQRVLRGSSSCLQIKKRIPAPFALYTVYLVALQRL